MNITYVMKNLPAIVHIMKSQSILVQINIVSRKMTLALKLKENSLIAIVCSFFYLESSRGH